MNVGCRTLGEESEIFNEHQRVKKRKKNLPDDAILSPKYFVLQPADIAYQ